MSYVNCNMCYIPSSRAEYVVVAGDLFTKQVRDFGVCYGHLLILKKAVPPGGIKGTARGYQMDYGRFHADMLIYEAVETI